MGSMETASGAPAPSRRWVMVVEDDAAIRDAIARFLEAHELFVVRCGSFAEARAAYAEHAVDVVVSDFRLEDGDALDLLRWLRAKDAHIAFFILTGFGTIDLAVRALQEGAVDFLTKPVELPRLLHVVQRAALARRPSESHGPTRFVA